MSALDTAVGVLLTNPRQSPKDAFLAVVAAMTWDTKTKVSSAHATYGLGERKGDQYAFGQFLINNYNAIQLTGPQGPGVAPQYLFLLELAGIPVAVLTNQVNEPSVTGALLMASPNQSTSITHMGSVLRKWADL